MTTVIQLGSKRSPTASATPRIFKVEQRLTGATRADIVAAYEAGTSSTRLTKHFCLGKGTILRLLHEDGVQMRNQR
jgi:hypothetical protein